MLTRHSLIAYQNMAEARTHQAQYPDLFQTFLVYNIPTNKKNNGNCKPLWGVISRPIANHPGVQYPTQLQTTLGHNILTQYAPV